MTLPFEINQLRKKDGKIMRTSPLFPDWSKDQWMVLAVLCVTHLCNGMCVSLQAPFYPAEAEKKGASATEYGLVFGIFELTVFIVSPFVGKILPKVRIYKYNLHISDNLQRQFLSLTVNCFTDWDKQSF